MPLDKERSRIVPLTALPCAALLSVVGIYIVGCSSTPVHGPDKVVSSTAFGTLQGAGAGAVTGAQLSAGAGPGVAVGAGLGAVVGAINGFVQDASEDAQQQISADTKAEKQRIFAQAVLAEHYKRRTALHPARDIYPADIFFRGDSVSMCPSGVSIIEQLAGMNEFRLPYSRLIIASYAKGKTPESPYAQHLSEKRSREFVNQLVRAGVEPRRLETRAVVIDAPVVIDPYDNPTRYNQAIEIITIDR
ncbi:MAG: hypothetical protein NTV65_02405 [Proteobacteria bacterium]|nr:hypothetical protein [Pseudomonadota bacterium]